MDSKAFNIFDGGSDIVVTGQNPEMADVDNPRGDIHGFLAWVRASNPHGDAKILYLGTYPTEWVANATAFKLAQALQTRFDKLGKLPVAFDTWAATRPLYGSEAYIEYGAADDLALEKLEG